MIECDRCRGDGKVPNYSWDDDLEQWDMCPDCEGEGTIPDPDDFENILNDLVQAKEINYDNE